MADDSTNAVPPVTQESTPPPSHSGAQFTGMQPGWVSNPGGMSNTGTFTQEQVSKMIAEAVSKATEAKAPVTPQATTPTINPHHDSMVDFGPSLNTFDVNTIDDPVLKSRLKGVGVLSKQDAIDFCAVGPTARASGVATDVRKDEPNDAYITSTSYSAGPQVLGTPSTSTTFWIPTASTTSLVPTDAINFSSPKSSTKERTFSSKEYFFLISCISVISLNSLFSIINFSLKFFCM